MRTPAQGTWAVCLTITSQLPRDLGNIPMSPTIDFGQLIAAAGGTGVLDPNSIQVIDAADGSVVDHALTEDFAYGDCGRVEWVVVDPGHRKYEIRFATGSVRPPLAPQSHVPMIGVGDLLRWNAGEPRPVTMYSMRLLDLTGDGRPDLAGTWNYYHRPGSPISGVVCYPRVGADDDFSFGDMVWLQYVEERGSSELKHFPGTYVDADFVDVDGDGLVDLVFAERGSGEITFFLNTGDRTPMGLPTFVRDRTIAVPPLDLGSLCVVDVDGSGVLDLIVEGNLIRNANPDGWPFEPVDPVDLGAGPCLAFLDVDGDGRLDMLSLTPSESCVTRQPEEPGVHPGGSVTWHRRLDSEQIQFGQPQPVLGLPPSCTRVATAVGFPHPAILAQHHVYQQISLFELDRVKDGAAHFTHRARAESPSAVLAMTDQSWPCQCDWDENGVQDLLIGGGYGWPRILRNRGSNQQPSFAEPELLLSGGEPIRVQRDEILHSHHWHNMGYPYPVFVDWDGDGLPDLMLPNETNRIVWYRNIGSPEEPRFGPRQFLQVEGYPDSDETRAESGRKGEDASLPNSPYPRDPGSPFFWRNGAAFADWNDDGLMDVITHDEYRKATLFVQYRADDGSLRLKKHGHVRLVDGREIDDSVVGRQKHWTESFRAIDWDGEGLLDLVYSTAATGHIYLLRNVGSASEPVFDLPRQFKCYGEPIGFTIHGPNAWAGDFDGDGKPDLLGCVEWSVYPFFSHAALEMDAHPGYEMGAVRPG